MIDKLKLGAMFLHYRIEAELGQGGMGVVYKALDTKLNRYVALKIVNMVDEKDLKRFQQEVRTIAILDHPNIVKLKEVGIEPIPYFTMEYVPGETLSSVIRNQSLDEKVIARIMIQVAAGLYHAHFRGVTHRDIKPANIMITYDLEPKIMDFGLAKNLKGSNLSQSGVEGTPAYLAPEQLQNKRVDKRVDIYSLGITLYEALTGHLPFEDTSYVSLFYQIVNEPPIPPRQIKSSISAELEAVCLRCLDKNPRNRYANAKYLQKDLEKFLEGKELYARAQNRVAYHIRNYWKTWRLENILLLFGLAIFMIYFLSGKKEITNEKTKEDFLPDLIAKKESYILERYEQQQKVYAAEIHDYSVRRTWLSKNPSEIMQETSKVRIQESADEFLAHYMSVYGYFVVDNFLDNSILESCEKVLELAHQMPETYYTLEKIQKTVTFLEIYRHKHYRRRFEFAVKKNSAQVSNMTKRIKKIENVLMKGYMRVRTKEWKIFATNVQKVRKIKRFNLQPRIDEISNLLDKIDFDNWDKLWQKLLSFAQELEKRSMNFAKFNDIVKHFSEINKRISADYNSLYENEFSYLYKFEISNSSHWEKEKNLLSAISFGNHSIFYQKLVDFYEKFDLHKEIISLCTKGLQLNPNECLLHYFMAKTQIYLGNYHVAQQHLDFILTNYPGSRRDIAYVQQARLYILTNKYELAEKFLEKAKRFIADHKGVIGDVLLWQYVFFTLQNQTTKANDAWNELKSYESGGNSEVRHIFSQMKIYRELKMFDKAYDLWNNDLNNFDAKKEKLLTSLAELESLKWEIGVPYVAELWEKTYIELLNELKKNSHETGTLWYRKIARLLMNRKGNERIQETIREHIPKGMQNMELKSSNFHHFYKSFLPDDISKYYIVNKLVADIHYTESFYGSVPLFYEEVFQDTPWFKQCILQRDINLAYCFIHNYPKYAIFSEEVAKNILQRYPGYSPAYTLLGKHYMQFNPKEAIKYYEKVDENTLSPRERKNFNHDFGTLHLDEKKYDKALEKFNTWKLLEPGNMFADLYPGICYQKMKKYQEALDCFNNLVHKDDEKTNPDRKEDIIHSYQNRASLYEEWGDNVNDRAKQREYYQNALKDWNSVVSWNSKISQEKQNNIHKITEKIKALGE